MAVIEITKENFEQEVLNASVPVLVDFWAPWCGPCKQVAPLVDEFASDMQAQGIAKVVKVNIDDNQELAVKYQVQSIPTFAAFANKEVIAIHVGGLKKDGMLKLLGL